MNKEHQSQGKVADIATMSVPDTLTNAYVASNGMPWTEAKPGVWVKTLFDGGPDVGKTLLFKLDLGARSAPHAHDTLEQIFVLEGEFHDGERLLGTGDACVRPPGLVHTAATETGALALVIYGPAAGKSNEGPS